MNPAATTIPLGCFQCEGCKTISAVYAFPIICRDCSEEFCESCCDTDEAKIEDDEHGKRGVCQTCANERRLDRDNPRERGDDDGMEYGDPRDVL